MMNRELIKQYKNGNKLWRYYEKCEVCGGTGYLKCYAYHDEGICYTCSGSGIHTWTEKEITPENQAIADAKEAKRIAEFKANKAEQEARELAKEIDRCHKLALIENKWFDQKKAEAEASGYVGNIGDKITVKVTLTVSFYWESQYGTQYMHLMKDASGNVYKWMTNRSLGYDVPAEGNNYYMVDKNDNKWAWHIVEEHNKEEFIITGTVKDHAEYKGVKQTVLTRCKVKAAE